MKEYLISFHENCTYDQMWNALRQIKPKTPKMEIISTLFPIFSITIDENDLEFVKSMPEINVIESNSKYETFDN
jgi:hypothetical protein